MYGDKYKKISIIVPIYNAEKYIRNCIESILVQNYSNWELVLINDGSTDDTESICSSFVEADKRIFYFYKNNGGVSSSRNYGIAHSTGDYICFIDADDFVEYDFCKKLLESVQEDTCMVVKGLKKYFSNGKTSIVSNRMNRGYYSVESIINDVIDDGTLSGFTFHSSCSILFNREIIMENNLKFNTRIKYNEDGLFVTEYLLMCKKGNVSIDFNNALYYYRVNEKSASHNINLDEYNLSLKLIDEKLQEYNKSRDINLQILRRHATVILDLLLATSKNGIINYKIICNILNEWDAYEAFNAIDIGKIKFSKRFIVFLIRNKLYFCIKIFLLAASVI